MIICPFIVHWEKRGHKSPCVSLENFFFISMAVPFTSACPACVHMGPYLRRTGKDDPHVYTWGLIWEGLEKMTPRFVTIQSLSALSTAGILPKEQKTWREKTLPNLKVTIYIIESFLPWIVSFDPQNSQLLIQRDTCHFHKATLGI